MNIKVTVDSTNDLSPELIQKNNIDVIPLYVRIGDQMFRDGEEAVPEDIFRHVEAGKGIGGTAAVNSYDYQQFFAPLAAQYDAVIHISLSSKLSVTHQNARTTAEEFSNVYVIDSENLSTGSGHLALDAVEMAAKGMAAEEICEELKKTAKRVEASFVLDTLEYLRLGGRCSSLAAYGAALLRFKPCIEVKDGGMQVGKKYRGALAGCLKQYVQERLQNRDDIDYSRIFITHTRMDPELVNLVREQVELCGKFENIYETNAGCTIANHCGPGCLGILFKRKA